MRMKLVLAGLLVMSQALLFGVGAAAPAAANGADDAAAAVAHASSQGYRSSVGVLDLATGQFWGGGDYDSQYVSESVMKVFVATRLLVEGQMSGWNETTAYKMITQSDNASTNALYGRVGGDGVITWAAQQYGLPNLGAPPTQPGWWGGTRITAHGLTLFYNAVAHDARVWPWLDNAMRNATQYGSAGGGDQYFGLPKATTTWAIKQGWGTDGPNGQAEYNSTGTVGPDQYAVAILTQGGVYGTAIYNMLSDEAKILLPGGVIRPPLPRVPTPTTVALRGTPTTAVGVNVALTATLTPPTTTGTVTFTDGNTPITSCAAVPVTSGSATCVTTFTTAGPHTVTATYTGDSLNTPSSTTTPLTVDPIANFFQILYGYIIQFAHTFHLLGL